MVACTCRKRRLPRRAVAFAQWFTPAATLALIPKCPMCLAGYVAVATGLGVSVPAATYLRIALVGTCVTALAYLTFRKLKTTVAPTRRT